MRTVHFFGLDAETRNQVAKGFSDKMGGFFCTDRELPTASTESPFARWLRTIGTVASRNNVELYVPSGYFPTLEARVQFRDNPDQYANTMSVWVDTVDEADALPPTPVPNAPSDFKWEKPSEDEYHFVITKSLGSIDSMIAQVVLQYDRHFS
jgi:hypothetical protein